MFVIIIYLNKNVKNSLKNIVDEINEILKECKN